MHVKSIAIEGYMGIPPGEEKRLVLDNLGQHNVLIGPNNAGKSIVVRFLYYLKQFSDKVELGVASNAPNTMSREYFWEQDTNNPIIATFGLDIPEEAIEGSQFVHLVYANTARFRLTCAFDGKQIGLTLMPLVFSQGQWFDAFKGKGSPRHCLERNGQYTTHNSEKNWAETFRRILTDYCVNSYFFDAVRSLDRGGDDKNVDDGSRLLRELAEFSSRGQSVIEWSLFVEQLCKKINEVFHPCGLPDVHRIEMKKGDRDAPQMWLFFSSKSGRPVNLQMMGTGIAQIVIMLAAITRRAGTKRLIVAEELETHLHPALLRGFLKVVKDDPLAQFVVTTHSPTVIEDSRKEDRIFRFRQDPADLHCYAVDCREAVALHGALDGLGIRGSDLLQANCVLWVEGPSDRLYLRQWISIVAPELVEGRDYVFVFYNGTLLAHCSLALDDEDGEEFVQMLRVCRFSAVLADRDVPRNLGSEGLARRKQRVEREARVDPVHRVFAITNGREIENDVPTAALLSGAALLTKRDHSLLQSFILDPDTDYSKAIANSLTSDSEESKRLANKLDDKVALARLVVAAWSSTEIYESCPDYVDSIVALIRRSQGQSE